MPRGGSNPGERRGSRQKGSLNKLSIGRVKATIATTTPEFDSLAQLRLIAWHFLDQATAEGKKEKATSDWSTIALIERPASCETSYPTSIRN
jgi:hypothetical protein